MADLTFSTTLLGQFLEDMEAYAEVNKTLWCIPELTVMVFLINPQLWFLWLYYICRKIKLCGFPGEKRTKLWSILQSCIMTNCTNTHELFH